MKLFFHAITVIAVCFVLLGCPAIAIVPALVSMVPSAIGTAADISKGQYKDLELVCGKGYKRKDLQKYKSVAFIMGEGNQGYFVPGISTIFSDNLAKEFMAMGFNVVDRDSIESTVEEIAFQRGKFANNKNLSKVGQMVGAQGIFKGSVQSGHDFSAGFMGIGAGMTQGILGATLKLIDIETTKVVLIISATFKKPKDAAEVAKDVATAFELYSKEEEPKKEK